MTDWHLLKDDPRTQEAIDSLLGAGLPADRVPLLLQHLSIMPELAKLHCVETAEQKAKRRAALAKRITDLARGIMMDPEARHYRLFDHESVTTTPLGNRMTVSEFLEGFAQELKRPGKAADGLDELSPERRETRSTEKQFIVREVVSAFLDLVGKQVNPRPIKPLTKLACVVLGDGSVTAQNVRDAFRRAEKDRGWN